MFADQSQAELGQLNNKMEEYLAEIWSQNLLINSKMLKNNCAVNQQHYRAFKKHSF